MTESAASSGLAALDVVPNAALVCAAGSQPRVGLIIVGDEILSGKRQDKHLTHCIEALAQRGMALAWARYVGDEPEAIVPVLQQAFESGDLVFCCGGIGATPDDQTRQSAAQALGVPLALHPQAKLLIEARMQDTAAEQGLPYEPQRADNLHRLNMGVFPEGASLLPNPYNRIPGFSCAGPAGGAVHFMPGFPVMAWPMMDWVLTHYAAAWHHQQSQCARSVIVFGVPEGTLGPMLERMLESHPSVKVFSLPSVGNAEVGPHIEVGVKGETQASNEAYADLLLELKALNARLGDEMVRQN